MEALTSVLLSSILFALSHPNFLNPNGWGLMSFICLVPFFYYMFSHTLKKPFFYGFVFGFSFYLFLNFWLYNFEKFALVALPLLKGIEWGLTIFVLNRVLQLFKDDKPFFTASVITISSYLCECGFLGYSYGNIAYTLYRYPLLIQVCDIFGIWFVVFTLVFVNATISLCFCRVENKNKFISIGISFTLVAFILVYGAFRIESKKTSETENTYRIAVVQHNADTYQGGNTQYKKNLNTLKALTFDVLSKNPDLVVWSETSLVPSIRWHRMYRKDPIALSIVNDFLHFASNINVPLIFGNGDAVYPYNESSVPQSDISLEDALYYNSAFLYENGIQNVYHKQHLVPFSESFPYKDTFKRSFEFLKKRGYHFWDAGNETNIFTLKNGLSVFTPICFEDTFTNISRKGIKKGAKCIVNLTNDYWSLSKVSEMQHLSSAVFRSVENNVPTIRSTNSGASCYIEPSGKINGLLPFFEEATGVYDVKIYKSHQTLYTFCGNIPVIIFCVVIVILVLIKQLTLCFKRDKI